MEALCADLQTTHSASTKALRSGALQTHVSFLAVVRFSINSIMNLQPFIWIGVCMAAAMSLLYALHLRKQDAGLADVGWTGGLGVAAIYLALAADGWGPRRALIAALVLFWSLRLFTYLVRDRIAGREEDARYRSLRNYWGIHANRNFFFVFQAQSVLVLIFAVPIYALMTNPAVRFGIWEILGGLVWLVSVAGESAADHQLARFRSEPSNQGRVCNRGLWRYSRHPNYFFEWLHWCSYVVMSIGAAAGWLTLIGPIVMWVFLWNITGIPATEKRAVASRGEAYRTYQQTTNAFFPWFPRTST